ncbi:MAG: M48 family metalloprotease [Opitutaceae bacterium]
MSRRRILFLAVVTVGLVASSLRAQFDFKKLQDGLNKAANKAQEVGSKAKEVAKVAKGVAGIGPEEERVIGGSVTLEIIGAYGGLVRTEADTKRVNLIGKSLARYSDRPELDWRFGILASDSVNAFSAPAGYVFITRGLYEVLGSDDALAAVLAHEIAHIAERHALKIVARAEFISGASTIAAERSSDLRAVEAQLQQFDLGVAQITKTLFEQGFDPATEYDADKKGRELAVVTGYAPGALRAVLTQLKTRSPAAGNQKVFSTHPPIDERLKRLPADAK